MVQIVPAAAVVAAPVEDMAAVVGRTVVVDHIAAVDRMVVAVALAVGKEGVAAQKAYQSLHLVVFVVAPAVADTAAAPVAVDIVAAVVVNKDQNLHLAVVGVVVAVDTEVVVAHMVAVVPRLAVADLVAPQQPHLQALV